MLKMPASTFSSTPTEAAVDLRSFVISVSTLSPSSSLVNYRQLTNAASTLLDTQPVAAREAVLALWSSLADLSLDLHLSGAVVRGNLSGRSSVDLLSEVSVDLSARMERAPLSWAPHLAKQALGVLGELSAKYTARLLAKVSKSSNLGLHEALPLWLDCPAPRTLLDVTAQCLRVLEEEQELTEACVSVLLDISVKHSPNFDWVVAHIGGCFPETVITRVLNVGLKEFCQSAEQQMKKDGKFNVGRVPKLNSVVGILGHLAVTHKLEIGSALGLMLDETLLTPSQELSEQSEGIIPYLLNLASLSDVLRKSLSDHLLAKVTVDTADRIAELTDKWRQRFFSDPESLLSLSVHLILKCEESGKDVLRILFDLGSEDSDGGRDVRSGCRQLLDRLLCDLQIKVYQRQNAKRGHHYNAETMPLLTAFGRCYEYFVDSFIFSDDVYLRRCLVTLLIYLAHYQDAGQKAGAVAIAVVRYCLQHAEDEDDLGAMFEFIRDVELAQPEVVNTAVARCLSSREPMVINLLRNIGKALQYQAQPAEEQKVRIVSQFSDAVAKRHIDLLPRLGQRDHLPFALKIFHFVPLSRHPNIDMSIIFRSAHCFAHALFMLLDEDESATATPRVRRMRRASAKSRDEEEDEDDDPTDAGPEDGHLLVAGCVRALQETADLYPSAGLPMVLRFLLEGALESKFARLFGGKFVPQQEKQEEGGARSGTFPHFTSLLEENMNFGSTPTHPLGTATVFHAGTIGRGRREGNNLDRRPPLKRAQVEYNQSAFLCAVFKICHGQSGADAVERSRDACRHLALLLVDMVSPDVMYNGLPWPDEDFARVTIERDLKIDKSFEEHPLLWKLTLALAEARPALCYCSVLIRALVATQINFWQASVARRARDCPKQLETLKNTLELMSVGQFLPHPLNALSDVIGKFHPFHVHCVLVDLWNFMKDHVPSPVAFVSKEGPGGPLSRDFEEQSPAGKNYRSYFERLRLVMIHHVSEMPQEFKRFFVDVESKQEQDLKLAMDY